MAAKPQHHSYRRQSHCSQWLCLILPLLLSLAGCDWAPGGREPGLVQLAGQSMGTTWHVSYVAPPGLSLPAEQVQAQISGLLEKVEQSMSTYRHDSEISRFNRAASGEWFALSPAFLEVLDAALAVGLASEGAYDVTVGPLVDLWGFGAPAATAAGASLADNSSGARPVPDKAKIDALRATVGQQQLELDRQGRRARKPAALALDFSSIAKGYGVDVVADWLAAQPIVDFLVEVGGEVRLGGRSARGDLWRIAIERPEAYGSGVAEALALTDVAVATSGSYRNFFERDGQRYSHSIDPRTGFPVAHDLVSVTVVHPSAMIADAWATALTVLGADDALRVALAEELAVYFIRRSATQFSSSHTPAMAHYLSAAALQ